MTRRIPAVLAVLGLLALCFLAFAAPAEGSGYGLGLAIPGWLCEYGGGAVLEDGPGLICAGGRFDGWKVTPPVPEWGSSGLGGAQTGQRVAVGLHAALAACHTDLRAARDWGRARVRQCRGRQGGSAARRGVRCLPPRPPAARGAAGPCPLPVAASPLAL